MPNSPYAGLDPRAFWRSGMAERHIGQADAMDIFRRKFDISLQDAVVTAGSCFAQHVARNMRRWGYNVLDAEPAPLGLPPELHQAYGFGLYSARHGNLYTTRQLRQLFEEACGRFTPSNWIWERDGGYFDALRPSVQPTGLETSDLVRAARVSHLKRFRKVMTAADVIVFTLGLTETWEDLESGTVFPTAPGTICGSWDPQTVGFRNLTHSECLEDFLAFRTLLKRFNPDVRFLLTVSPVPLTATASGDHVLPATVYSKSVLRGVAGELCAQFPEIDYFPSYEIVTAPSSRGFFYMPNMREVAPEAVDLVMRTFAAAYRGEEAGPAQSGGGASRGGTRSHEDIVCEEQLLEAFSG